MRVTVREAWPRFVSGWEGRVAHMYLDTLRYVTFGIGRKIDDNSKISDYGLARPWRDKAGNLVLETRIKLEWSSIKSHTELAPKGGYAFSSVATLHLDDADIDEALLDTTDDFWAALVRTLPRLETWPADAQLALLDMAYHMGPAFLGPKWPNFTAAAKAADFGACATHCQTSRRSPRDQAHVKLYGNAAAVSYAGLDAGRLWGVGTSPALETDFAPSLGALTSVSSAKVAASKPSTFLADAWYVQRMLWLAGKYKSRIDGQFGPLSRSAFSTWAKGANQPATLNKTVIGALSKTTLHMPVT
jgi:hypothetical protein